MNMLAKHSRYFRFIILIIPLFLIFTGMKVPDVSRPHKPKPMRQAVLDKTPGQTVLQSVVKIDIDPVITTPYTFVILATEEYFPEALPSFSSVPLLTLSPFPPRAPPPSPVLA